MLDMRTRSCVMFFDVKDTYKIVADPLSFMPLCSCLLSIRVLSKLWPCDISIPYTKKIAFAQVNTVTSQIQVRRGGKWMARTPYYDMDRWTDKYGQKDGRIWHLQTRRGECSRMQDGKTDFHNLNFLPHRRRTWSRGNDRMTEEEIMNWQRMKIQNVW